MKQKKWLIIGVLLISISLLGEKEASASYCISGQNDTHYKRVYCDMSPTTNEKADQEVVNIVATQFNLKEEIVQAILSDKLCDTLKTLNEEQKKALPENVLLACSPGKTTTGKQLFAQNLLSDVKNIYQKEKAMYFNQKALRYKLKASEDYWDGKVGGALDAPFDLISDLNLIEIVLFGSKAQWMGDVFTFPEKEEPKGEEDIIPLDEQLEKEKKEEKEKQQENIDEGLEMEDLTPECVPPDDPNADPNANPGSLSCGDGKIELLKGEQCDDGNKNSGDGCNQYCQIEGGGADKMCIDPEAVTFKKPTQVNPNQNPNDPNQQNDPELQCPPGLVPSKIPKIWDENENMLKEVPQAEEYPGPKIGGTLKQFPESERPLCPPDHTALEITIAGKKQVATNDNGEPRCLPTKLCADFDKARDFLFGPGWEEDGTKANVATSIEAMFCVDVVKNNRPLSPYPMIEGCIDCHIAAMVDALEKALTTNVTPFKNTTSAFGLSSKFGPTFSFNLITALKPKPTINGTRTTPQSLMNTNLEFEKSQEQEQDRQAPVSTNSQSSLTQLSISEQEARERAEKFTENVQEYNWSTGAISELVMGQRVVPLLEQMQQSFANIQSSYQSMVAQTAFNEKPLCQ